jgi:ABC-2 type transport system ATP-binding protein
MTAALEVRRLDRQFGEVQALRGVDLKVEEGEIHALLGPNGAGKTTLLRILAGICDPSDGEVFIRGEKVDALGYRERRKLFSMVPSGERSSYQRLSGFENLVFFGRLYGLSGGSARKRAAECLELVGLSETAKRRVGLYSQGMQKRLAIARALMVDPPLLLIDEATQSLDPEGARTTRALAKEAADRGAAVLWTTQRLDEIRGFADIVTVLRRGEVRFRGTVAELSGTVITRNFLIQVGDAGTNQPDQLLAGLADVTVAGNGHYRLRLQDGVSLGLALAALVEGGVEVVACREEISDVEEAFVRMTSAS